MKKKKEEEEGILGKFCNRKTTLKLRSNSCFFFKLVVFLSFASSAAEEAETVSGIWIKAGIIWTSIFLGIYG